MSILWIEVGNGRGVMSALEVIQIERKDIGAVAACQSLVTSRGHQSVVQSAARQRVLAGRSDHELRLTARGICAGRVHPTKRSRMPFG